MFKHRISGGRGGTAHSGIALRRKHAILYLSLQRPLRQIQEADGDGLRSSKMSVLRHSPIKSFLTGI
uniref:Uncharacterized protein n=1 Tax=Anguilla anguilla TaxID=7936 RepID=A0A0E9V604_ANGAN